MSGSTLKKAAICLAFVGLNLRGSDALAQHVDTSVYAILSIPNNAKTVWFPAGSQPAALSSVEIDTAERILWTCIEKYNVEQKESFERNLKNGSARDEPDYITSISQGKRQYVCAISPDGEKLLWINYLCMGADDRYWRKYVISVDDGGSCFFQIKINLTKRTSCDFYINSN